MSVEETKRIAVQRGSGEGGNGGAGAGAGMSPRNSHEPFLRTLADDVQPVDSAVAATEVSLLFSEANEVELAFLMRLIAEGDTATASRIAQRIVAGKTSIAPPEQPKAASMPPQLKARAQALVAQPVSPPVRAKRTRVVSSAGPDRQSGMLSPRELSVLRMISQGLSNREIAEASYRSTHTVDAQVKNIYRKLGVKSRAQAVRDAMQKDLLNPRAGA